jgi:hypothetical protein
MLKTHVEKRANFFQLYKCSFVENYLVYVGCRFFSRLFTGVFFAKKMFAGPVLVLRFICIWLILVVCSGTNPTTEVGPELLEYFFKSRYFLGL